MSAAPDPARWVRNTLADPPPAAGQDRRVGRDGSPLAVGPARGVPETQGTIDLVGLYDLSSNPTEGDS